MSEKATTARKGPAKLGEDLDAVFAPKGAMTAPSKVGAIKDAGAADRPEPADKEGVTSSTIRIPHYLSDRISDYLHANKGDTLTTLVFKGLTKLGIEVEPGDLVPKRQRRSR